MFKYIWRSRDVKVSPPVSVLKQVCLRAKVLPSVSSSKGPKTISSFPSLSHIRCAHLGCLVKHLFYSSRLFTSQKRTAVAADKPQGTEYTSVANGEVIAVKNGKATQCPWERKSLCLKG